MKEIPYVKVDDRPPLGWWAPGEYLCQCHKCDDWYKGDKRSGVCADCAYQSDSDITHPYE